MTQPRIRTQAYLVGAVPLAFLLVLLALSLLIQARSQAFAALEQHTQTVIARRESLESLLAHGSRVAISPQLAANAPAQLAAVRAQIEAELAKLRPMIAHDPGMPARMAKMSSLLHEGLNLLDRYVALRRAGNAAAAHAIDTAPATRTLSMRINAAYEGFTNQERQDELAAIAGMRTVSSRYTIALVIVSLAGVLVTLLVSGRFGLGIAGRLAHLADNARRLARGEKVAPLSGNDEFTDLDVVYQAMMRRIAREHKIAATLQRTLLPHQLPTFEGIRIDTAYVPAAHETDIGGDWYDAFAINDRCICISIGDVSGHGLHAATVMASARLAVRTAARMQAEPAQIMAHLNRVMCLDEPGTLVTALVAMFDVDTGSLRYAVAGHPEPLVVHTDGELHFLGGRGLLIGVDENVKYETFHAQLHEGWALLLYTDGLVEVTHDYFTGLDDLCAATSDEFASASGNIAEAIQERVFGGRSASDDAALLFIGVTRLGVQPRRGPQKWTLDARDAQSAHRAKRAILWHLGNDIIRDKEQLASIELILGELIGNVARHSPGVAEVSVEQQADQILLCVSDRGSPFPFGTGNGEAADLLAESGRGLFLVRAMSRDLRIENDGSGNVITAVVAS